MFKNSILCEIFHNTIIDRSMVYPDRFSDENNGYDNSSSVFKFLMQYTDDPSFAVELYKFDYTTLIEYVCSNLKNPVCLEVLKKLVGKYKVGKSMHALLYNDNVESVKLILEHYPNCLNLEHIEYFADDTNPITWCKSPEALNLIMPFVKDRINTVTGYPRKKSPLSSFIDRATYYLNDAKKNNNETDQICKSYAVCVKILLDNGADPQIERASLQKSIKECPSELQALINPLLGFEYVPSPVEEVKPIPDKKIVEDGKVIWEANPKCIVLDISELEQYPVGSVIDTNNLNLKHPKIYTNYGNVILNKDIKYIAKIKNNTIHEIIRLDDQPEMEFLLSKGTFGYQVTDMESIQHYIEEECISVDNFKGIIVKSKHYKHFDRTYYGNNRQAVVDIELYKDEPHKSLIELGIMPIKEYNAIHFKYVDTSLIRITNELMSVLEKYKDTVYMRLNFPTLYQDFILMLKKNEIDCSNSNLVKCYEKNRKH